ncbi:glycoside hydrolase [Aspergillus heteromorphus CBS 117.55]|uniref:Probable beta-glucosidase btgE n=1 Tax=Aspergillus heteromorphus CBS 117.55 TaxID=1448321 RepID=A0A317WT14_9EURO|nr:glycoside hydrolase [Aspergillus heteromorphus CBS 117.55]PWY89245.1 glycoside hydrolase [Aspergillus heteromorphus CBS 117.55]
MRGAFLATAAAAMAGTALADGAHRRHAHDSLHHNRAVQAEADNTCACTTEVVTVWGSPTLVPVPTTITSEVVTTLHSTSYTTVTVVASESVGEAATTTTEVVGATGGAAGSAAPSESSTPAEGASAGSTGGAAGSVGELSSSPAAAATTSSTVAVPTAATTVFSTTGTYTIPASTITVTVPTTVIADTTTSLASGTQLYGGETTSVPASSTVTYPYATVETSGSTVTTVIESTTYVCPSAGSYTIAPTTTYVPSNTIITYPAVSTVTPGVYTHSAETVVVTVTDYTYTCPFANAESTTSVVAATSAVSVPAVTTTVVAAETTAAAAVTTSIAAEETTAAAAVTTTVAAEETTAAAAVTTSAAATTVAADTSSVVASSSSSSAAAASSGVSASGNSMGMTYTPYTDAGGCKSESTVDSDIAIIAEKGFTHIRLYSTDCSTLEYVGTAAAKYGLKLILGVYISSTGTSGAADQITAITEWKDWTLVTLIVVGNEAISDGYTTAAELATFITSSKASFEAAGYTGEITTTEPIDIWQEYGTSNLCSVVDVVGANIHPFFNAQTTAAEAGTFAEAEVKILKAICTDKTVINLETGWPSAGDANGLAVPGVAEQTTAIKGIRESVGEMSVFFSYANDLWKDPGEFDVEQYWGCIDQF